MKTCEVCKLCRNINLKCSILPFIVKELLKFLEVDGKGLAKVVSDKFDSILIGKDLCDV